jgi:predicted Zn-dependent peptidase
MRQPIEDESQCQTTRLPNGVRVVSEYMPQAKTVSLGLWIEAGSRHEAPGQEGFAHIWEHMAFKGTTTRDTLAIAKELDRLGGLANAYTSREVTCYYVRVMDAHLPRAFDIMADIALHPVLDSEELRREQGVILQEISMVEETPEDKINEDFWQAAWENPAVAHSIAGSAASVSGATPKALLAWRREHYRPSALTVVAAGAVSHEALTGMAARGLDLLPLGAPPDPSPAGAYRPARLAIHQDCEQHHVILAFPAVGNKSAHYYAHSILATLLGGNMSSRLFQEVREKRGLAYAIDASLNALADVGLLEIQAAVDPGRTGELLGVVQGELDALVAGRITLAELNHTREHLKGLLYLGAESTENRMMRLARSTLLFDRNIPLEETAAALDAVTLADLVQTARNVFDPAKAGLCVLGPKAQIP